MAFTVPAGMAAWPPLPKAEIRATPSASAVTFTFSVSFSAEASARTQRISTVRHHIVGHAALKVDEAAVQRCAHQPAAVAALFPVVHRELGVRREAECGLGIVFQVVIHVFHAGLLVGAQQDAQRIGQRGALLLEEFGSIQRQYSGAFVVGHAASHDIAVAAHHIKRGAWSSRCPRAPRPDA